MKNYKDPFKVEKLRAKLAKEERLNQLLETYTKRYPEIQDQNTPALWDYLNTEGRKLIKDNPMEEDRLNFVKKLIVGQSIQVLNIGFGSANLESKYFKSHAKRKVYWHGIEISEISIKAARKKFPGEKFKKGDISDLKFPNNYFDFVIALEVLEHIKPSNTLKSLKEAYRVVKSGNYFIVSVPLNEGLEKMIAKGENPNAHVRMYTPDLIKTELKIAGFKIIKEKILFAFGNLYRIKSFIAQYLLLQKFKPNNIIILAQKP